MFRKLLVAGIASLGLLASMTFAPQANAHEFRHEARYEHHHEYRHEHCYHLFYRDPCRPGWVCAGTFEHHREAERCAEQYRCRGFAISIR
jgi:hypothetical protein